MNNTILVDLDAYIWLGRVIEDMDNRSMNNKPVGKLTWEASNAYDALTENLKRRDDVQV